MTGHEDAERERDQGRTRDGEHAELHPLPPDAAAPIEVTPERAPHGSFGSGEHSGRGADHEGPGQEAPSHATRRPHSPRGEDRFLLHAPRTVFVGQVMIGLNIAWFLWMALHGVSVMQPSADDGLRFGSNFGPAIASGEWWRLLSAAFVHYGLFHLAMNMWALWVLAPLAERLYGRLGYLLLYLLGAVGCSAASMLMGPEKFSAGASGAVFATIGGIFVFFLLHKRDMPAGLFAGTMRRIVPLLGFNLMFGFMVPGIDNAGHFGGLALGIAAGWCLDRDPAAAPALDAKRFGAALFLALMLAGICTFIPARVAAHPEAGASLALARAAEAGDRRDWAAVERNASEALESDRESTAALGLRARARAAMGRPEAALEDCDLILRSHPELQDARKMRAVLRAELGRLDEAHVDLLALAHADPADPGAQRMLGSSHLARGDVRDAALALEASVKLETRGSGATELDLWMARTLLGLHAEAAEGLEEFARSLHGEKMELETRHLFAIARGEAERDALEALDGPNRALGRLLFAIRALRPSGNRVPDRTQARADLEAATLIRDPWLAAFRARLLGEL